MARFIGSRKDLTEDKLEELEELVMDTTKAQAIFEAARVSMGEHSILTDGKKSVYFIICKVAVKWISM